MARRKRSSRQEFPGWAWMLFGLSVGLSVALAIYLQDRGPLPDLGLPQPKPATIAVDSASGIDENGENPAAEKEPRFTFYDMLPKFEVVIPDQEPDVRIDSEPHAIDEPGVYVLQAGSFSTFADADRRRAVLAMQGIESKIQRVSIDDKTYHRVRIGPIDDLEILNVTRSRLRAANIDVLRIKLGE